MRSNFAPRLGVRARVGVRRARAPRPPRPARGDRAPARPVRRGRGALGHLGAAHRADRPLARAPRAARVVEEEDPDLLVLQLLAADQLGHVRGVRNPEYLDQIAETDRHVGDFLALPRRARQARRRHRDPDGRPRPGPRHRRPRPPRLGRAPGAVRGLGRGRACPARSAASRARSASWPPPSPRCWAWRPPRRRGAGRWCPCSTPASSRAPRPAARSPWWSPATRSRAVGRVLAGLPPTACGMPVDVLLVDDGSRDATAAIGREHGARGALARALARPRRGAAHRARARARRGLRRRRLPRRRRRVRPRRLRARARARRPRPRRLRARLALPRARARG